MTSLTRMFVAATAERGRPKLARIDIDGAELRCVMRDYVDPMIRSGRGGSCGLITALGSAVDVAGAQWLLAAVERGRPRLIDPETLGVVALLGRRREWRGAADERSPFLPVVCDRALLAVVGGVGDQEFVLSRSPRGEVDLLGVRPGEPLERWGLGEHPGRVELLAGDGALGFRSGARVAIVEIAELVPGGCPLTDPRDVELPLRWVALPSSVVAVCDLHDRALRVIERHGDRWTLAEVEIDDQRAVWRASWPIERPERWLAAGGSLWLAAGEVWTRFDAGPRERCEALGSAISPAAIELDDAGHPWLWLCERGELRRVDGLTLATESIKRWTIPAELSVSRLLVSRSSGATSPAPDPATILHADELAELLALAPELADAWRGWFD